MGFSENVKEPVIHRSKKHYSGICIWRTEVVDHNIITSRSPGTAMEFSFKLVEILFGKDRVKIVSNGALASIKYASKTLNAELLAT